MAISGQALARRLFFTSLVVGVFVFAVFLWNPQPLAFINLQICDLISSNLSPKKSPFQYALVAIDDTSLKKYGQWPWPRYRLAFLLQKIKESGARVIGMNILLPEADRTSLANWKEGVAKDLGLQISIDNVAKELLDHDRFLARTLSDGPFVLGYEFLAKKDRNGKSDGCKQRALQIFGNLLSQEITGFVGHSLLCNNATLAESSKNSGFFNGTVDPDGKIRRIPLLMRYKDEIYPSFDLAILLRAFGTRKVTMQHDFLGIIHLKFAHLDIGTDNQGSGLLNPRSGNSPVVLPASELLDNDAPIPILKNRIVLLGLTAKGFGQEIKLPLQTITNLPQLHLKNIANLASNNQPIRDDQLFRTIETVIALLLLLLLGPVVARFTAPVSVSFSVVLIGMCWFGAIQILQKSGYLFSPLLPILTLVIATCLMIVCRYQVLKTQADEVAGESVRQLASSESTLESVMRTIPDIVFRLNSDGQITYINPAVSRYNLDRNKLIGTSIFSLIAQEDLVKSKYRVNERRTGHRATTDLELRFQFKGKGSDTIRFFSLSAEGIYQESGKTGLQFLGTQGIARDINQRKKLERQLHHAQKMEVIGNMASGIAHDLNNILSGVVSYPDLLLLELQEGDPMREKIKIIQKSGQDAAAIVQDLLTLARRSMDVSTPCNLNQIIHDYLDSPSWRKACEAFPDVKICCHLHENLPNVSGSRIHLTKVIMNLLLNALESMISAGELTVTTSILEMNNQDDQSSNRAVPQANMIQLTIADQGIGIPEKDLDRIFEPFYSRKKLGSSGSGLGMTIVWTTIREHGGNINISSKEGCGTSVKIQLPTTGKSVETIRERFDLREWLGKEKVLVVDDNPDQRKIVQGMLKKLGYTVHTVPCGEEAVALIAKEKFDILLLDMVMPGGIDGLETYQQILAIEPKQRAVVATGFSESERIRQIQQIGVRFCIDKPYSLKQLAQAIRLELNGEEKQATD